ncbi:MAG: hypothetical protein M1827_005193 [Pycnora praestabilis]|nr:MAG: hypothetical protein M1827_005193 [Pycnora praestabilis]
MNKVKTDTSLIFSCAKAPAPHPVRYGGEVDDVAPKCSSRLSNSKEEVTTLKSKVRFNDDKEEGFATMSDSRCTNDEDGGPPSKSNSRVIADASTISGMRQASANQHASNDISFTSINRPSNPLIRRHDESPEDALMPPLRGPRHSTGFSNGHSASPSDDEDNQCRSRTHRSLEAAQTTPARSTSIQNAAGGSAASALKRTYSAAMGATAGSKIKLLAEHDPENHEIKHLRLEKGLKWGEIADILNKKRIAAGKVPGLTENAIYSRFTRNAPRIAAAAGEEWNPGPVVPPKNEKSELARLPPFGAKNDELLVKAYRAIQEETWDLVSDRMVEMGGKRFSAEACARRYQAI